MSIQIHIPKFSALHRETHGHKCPLHGKHRSPMVMESNEICGKTLAGTGREHHTFPCAIHYHDYRERFGIDTLLDSFIDLEQMARARHQWPDAHLDEREVDEAETNTEVAAIVKRSDEI